MEEFVENLYTDEIRSGFLVTSHRKKLWNVQIGLINEFARICKKHNLRWFAIYGTLLGAARHKGFVPWDDDVDLAMLRPEYEKFKQIAATEIKEPYYLDCWYNYRLDIEENPSPDESNFPLVDFYPCGWPLLPFLKIRDSRTAMIEYPSRKNCHQGIWIDIFPLDSGLIFDNVSQEERFWLELELLYATFALKDVKKVLEKPDDLILNADFFSGVFKPEFLNSKLVNLDLIKKFSKLSYRQKALTFEKLAAKSFFESEYVGELMSIFAPNKIFFYKLKNFENVVYLPFEKIELPAPADYDQILTQVYNNWRKPVFRHGHAQIYSTDISYKDYFEKLRY